MSSDVDRLLAEIIGAIRDIVEDDWSRVSAFSENQGRMLANQSVMIAAARTTGSLRDDDDAFAFFMSQLEEMTLNFARAIAALTFVTLEKAWNAVVGVVWGFINAGMGRIGLPAVSIPEMPDF